jgi:O-antigen ligase
VFSWTPDDFSTVIIDEKENEMNPWLATLAYACVIAGLFFLARDKTVRTSSALWLPVIYLWIVGSRVPTVWLGLSAPVGTDAQLDGTPLDRLIFTMLLVVGLIVLVTRSSKTIATLRGNWPIFIYLGYCLASVLWSDFPGVSAKRWVKAIGDLVMVLIIATDADPIGAFKRTISRVGFVLLPASVLFIKYFPALGRAYDQYVGTQMNTGVTNNKNLLGVVVLVVSLGAFWCVLDLLRAKDHPNRKRLLLAWLTLLAFGMALLVLANSATARACFALGAVLLVTTSFSAMRRRPGAVHGVILTIVLVAGLAMTVGGTSGIAHALGRKGDLTGRTEIWEVLIPMVPNPVVGAGFESFWLGPRVEQVRAAFEGNPLNEAHNGYIEVYLNLGWIGLALIGLMFISGYRNAAATFRGDPAVGSLLLSYIAVAAVYSVTEAGFRMLDPIWIFLLFAVVAASASKRYALRNQKTALELRQPSELRPAQSSDLATTGNVRADRFIRRTGGTLVR